MMTTHLIGYDDTLITGPQVEPLDLAEVKKQRRFASTTLDTLFDLWIAASRQHFESETGVQLMSATRELWLDEFPCHREIELPWPPLQSVTSITYLDGDLAEQTVDSDTYRVLNPRKDPCPRGRVALVSGVTWPTAACEPKSVKVRFVCGYGNAPGNVPEIVRYALMMLVGHFHKFGEEISEARANILQLPIGAQNVIQARKYMAASTLEPRRLWPGTLGGYPWRA